MTFFIFEESYLIISMDNHEITFGRKKSVSVPFTLRAFQLNFNNYAKIKSDNCLLNCVLQDFSADLLRFIYFRHSRYN